MTEEKKIKLDYVFSGTGMMRVLPSTTRETHTEEYCERRQEILTQGVKFLSEKYKELFPYYDIQHSMLYNAYDEPKVGKIYRDSDLLGFDNLYADSGGLQAMTRGITIDQEFKKSIYEKQKEAEYAFCFDEIPVEFKDVVVSAEFARTSVDIKQFNASRFKECALHTATNINEQLKSFEGSNTKAMYIVQGNTFQEMHDWVRWGSDKIDNIEQIHGIAPSGACLGNGALETCDMMMASRLVFDDHPTMKGRMHLLGVGAANRMFPAFQLLKSNFIDRDTILSFDSSTNCGCMMLGKFFDNQGIKLNNTKLGTTEMSMTQCLEFYEPFFKTLVDNYDQDELLTYIMANDRLRNIGRIENEAFDDLPNYTPITGVFVTLYSIWLNVGFFNRCANFSNDTKLQQTALGLLTEVNDVNDYLSWRREFKHLVKSTRMDRKKDTTIDNFFEDLFQEM